MTNKLSYFNLAYLLCTRRYFLMPSCPRLVVAVDQILFLGNLNFGQSAHLKMFWCWSSAFGWARCALFNVQYSILLTPNCTLYTITTRGHNL